MAHTFHVVDDRTGETKDATLDDVAEYQAQGYRIMNLGAYDAAVFEANQPSEPAPLPAAEQAMFEQGNKDAALMASEQYPAAASEGDDAKAADEAQTEAKADDDATKNPDEGNVDDPGVVADAQRPVVVKRPRA